MAGSKTLGKLIVFEGTDGTGKTTQLGLLGSYLEHLGFPVVLTKEPTNGPYGLKIRDLYKNRERYSREEELELFLADRRQHVDTFLLPSLDNGKVVLCDRYYFSTAAYQGALGLDPEAILSLNSFAPEPDLVLLFQADLDTSLQRITKGRGEKPNNFEQRSFLEKVASIFSTIDRPFIRTIDASKPMDEVHQMVVGHVMELLPCQHSSTVD